MDRAEWLKKMRAQAEALYDHIAPAYWVKFGLYDNASHREFIGKLLRELPAHSSILDAACGAGRYDGMLLEAGHEVLGIDQSGSMLARAREHFPQESFPQLRYQRVGLQEMDFQARFDGAICMDAMEHVSPEDWPGILARFQAALKLRGVLYVTVEVADAGEVSEAYDRARAKGLPVVYGELVDQVDEDYTQDEPAVYHYYPPPEQVRAWFDQAGLTIQEEGTGDGYWHLLARKGL